MIMIIIVITPQSPRLVEKAHQHLAKINGQDKLSEAALLEQIGTSLKYGRRIGNSYTASLYVGLTALLDLSEKDLSDKRIGFYSYGSGCVAEYFSGVVQKDYKTALNTDFHQKMLDSRTMLSYPEYEKFYSYLYPEDGSHREMPSHQTGHFRLAAIRDHKRIYERLT